ncbi:MAG: FHA domain-containing protein [Chloroflexota bacterium]
MAQGGTLVNGQPVAGAIVLGYGDEIGLGRVRLRLERASSGAGGR